jgi:hypothetical protein
MKLRWIDSEGVSERDLAKLPALQKRTGGFLWLDVPEWSDDAEAFLANEFHFHPMAISEAGTVTMFPGSMRIRTTCSSWCIDLRSAQAATCTIWSWTSSLARTSWEPFTGR